MTTAKDIRRHYVITCTALNVAYAVLVVLISWVIDLQQLPYALRVLAALSPAIPLIGVIYAFDRYRAANPTSSPAFCSRARRLWPAAWSFACSAPGAFSNTTPGCRASRC